MFTGIKSLGQNTLCVCGGECTIQCRIEISQKCYTISDMSNTVV